ncbi:MAG: motility associated factor glycosyltransferase family protein [Treponema sp.]|nr:motility associated factor glycosyltransferase family protein [Candidatus Treponema equifaecale]
MNSIWNKNIKNFIQRFPVLAQNYGFSLQNEALLQDIPQEFLSPLEIIPSKQPQFFTARENGKCLHSLYNPIREAQQTVQTIHQNTKSEIYGTAFFSSGLGYALLEYAKVFPAETIILVEWDARYFFTALSVLDWTDFFTAKNVILALNTSPDTVISIVEQCGGFNHIAISENPAQTQHAAEYFSALHSLIERNKRKNQINNSTLEKFSGLWLKNSCRNLHYLAELDGVSAYENKLPSEIPVLILAAGPTLSQVLPHLTELKKRCIIIAVDTALRACLKAGVEPDFIILADPQYYAYRHISGLSSPSSILLTESAAYPPVYRFNCKKIIMCSSLFPLGQYVESKLGAKGKLSAGGSVSTTAWDFARLMGAKEIVFSGLDLGYPDYQTHIRGSTFEEKIHTVSSRLSPAEKSGIASLFGANMEQGQDYNKNPILTDNRMKMFAWWFESKQEEFSATGLKSYSLSAKSLKIPGFRTMELSQLLAKPEILEQKQNFLNSCTQNFNKTKEFQSVLDQLKSGLEELYLTAKKGLQVADEGIGSNLQSSKYLSQLEEIDKKILVSSFKDIAALVFPTENQLNQLFENTVFSTNPVIASFQRSKIIYRQLMNSLGEYQEHLFN